MLAEARAHFADHCAVCHANNGSGDTEIGRSLYPRAPDMRKPETQQLSDGELFAIIERGVRLTGMPAWGTGTPEGVQQSWHLVHFIRHLPSITPAEIAEMERLNPKSPDEMTQEQDIERFFERRRPGEGQDRSPEREQHTMTRTMSLAAARVRAAAGGASAGSLRIPATITR